MLQHSSFEVSSVSDICADEASGKSLGRRQNIIVLPWTPSRACKPFSARDRTFFVVFLFFYRREPYSKLLQRTRSCARTVVMLSWILASVTTSVAGSKAVVTAT